MKVQIIFSFVAVISSSDCHFHHKSSRISFPGLDAFPGKGSQNSNSNDSNEDDSGDSSETALEECCLRKAEKVNTKSLARRPKFEFPPDDAVTFDQEFLDCGSDDVQVFDGDMHSIQSTNYPDRPRSSRRRRASCRWDLLVQPGVSVDLMCTVFDTPCNQGAMYVKVSSPNNNKPSFTRFTRRYYWSKVCLSGRRTNQRMRIRTSLDAYRLSIVGYHRALFSCTVVGSGGTSNPGDGGDDGGDDGNDGGDGNDSETGNGNDNGDGDSGDGETEPSAQCGVNALSKNSLIIRGTTARQGEFPWMVLLIIRSSVSCGASIIGSRWILTAAHCTIGSRASQITPYVGCHQRSTSRCVGSVEVDRNILHENYNSNTLTNDIALLRLRRELTFSDRVRAVCLPTRAATTPGYVMETAGWGRTLSGNIPNVLMKASMQSVTDSTCRSRYGGGLSTNVLCAEEITGSVCNGDSGGYLGSNRNGRTEQDGVVSFGSSEGCGIRNIPDGFTEVFQYLNWIRGKMQA